LLESEMDLVERRLIKGSGQASAAFEEGEAAWNRVQLILELRLIDADLIEAWSELLDVPDLREEVLPLVKWHIDAWLRAPGVYKLLEVDDRPAAPASGNPVATGLLVRVEVREVLKANPFAWPFEGSECDAANLEVGLELLRDSNPEVRRSVCQKLKHWPQGERQVFRPALELLLQDPYTAEVAGKTLSIWEE
jgi:hypothetical protein